MRILIITGVIFLLSTAQGIPGKWQKWTKCTKKCDGGQQTRTKKCEGISIPCGKVTASCNLMSCDDPYENSIWSECSKECGGGERWRYDLNGENKQTIECNTQACSTIYETCIGDFVFVLDSSGSIGELNWCIAKQFTMDVTKGLVLNTYDTRTGVVLYSTVSEVAFDIDDHNNVDDIVDATWSLKYMAGVTNTADGIMDARNILKNKKRPGVEQFVIVVTDGASTIDVPRTIPEAEATRAENITIFAVGIGDIKEDEINGIANDPDSEFVFYAKNYGEVQRITEILNEKLCNYTNPGKCDDCVYTACTATCGGGIETGKQQCWTVSKKTGIEIKGSRHWVACENKVCAKNDCTHRECSKCVYGDCSVSCDDGVQQGQQECWQASDVTNKEIPNTRHVVQCTNKACNLKQCTHEDCTQCAYSACSVSCDDGIQTGKQECWLVGDISGKEIENTRETRECPDITCNLRECTYKKCSNCVYAPCSQTCGEGGIQTGERDCWKVSVKRDVEISNTRVTEKCADLPCFVEECTTPKPFEPDCSRCDYTKGQIWLPNPFNCHLYYVCEPILNGEYRIHSATCGELYWHQAWHTCVREVPEDADCEIGDVVTAEPVPTPDGVCPYSTFGSNNRFFWIENDLNSKQHCVQGMIFNEEACSCIRSNTEEIEPTCSDDLLLHIPYDDHYNDVTCHQAIATQYGTNVELVSDSDRLSNVACFGGETYFEVSFIRTWFANQNVQQFTVSIWVKRKGDQVSKSGIVNNGDCIDLPSFELSAEKNGVQAGITTENDHARIEDVDLEPEVWHYLVWRYDGSTLNLYVDGTLMSQESINGAMTNPDVPLRIATCCHANYFVGCLDDLKIYTRALSDVEIANL